MDQAIPIVEAVYLASLLEFLYSLPLSRFCGTMKKEE